MVQATHGRLVLSPTDLHDYVECAHLTTLSREVALGTRRRPHVPEDHADLLRRKGEEHEGKYLAALRTAGLISLVLWVGVIVAGRMMSYTMFSAP